MNLRSFHLLSALHFPLDVHFMPIVRLSQRAGESEWEAIGWEALVRGPSDSPLRNPAELFAMASALDCLLEFDLYCITSALSRLSQFPIDRTLFINVHVDTLLSDAFMTLMTRYRSVLQHHRVVFEILEGDIPSYPALRARVSEGSLLGYRFAIDDIGGEGSDVDRMEEIGAVQFLKVDRMMATQLCAAGLTVARRWLARIQRQARRLGAEVVVEGVEDESMLRLMHRLGISLGQGYLFGRPTSMIGQASGSTALSMPSMRESGVGAAARHQASSSSSASAA